MKKRTMKRSIAMGLAVITAAGCLTGCGGSENRRLLMQTEGTT